jgi:hypothetical protein
MRFSALLSEDAEQSGERLVPANPAAEDGGTA